MKIYITARFKSSADNKVEIENLCSAVRAAGMHDFHFIRDVENYQTGFFSTPKDLWQSARQHIAECDALLIDISDNPSGGRVVEAGIAYALGKPIYVIVKNDIDYKDFYNGIADAIIHYDDIGDITDKLKAVCH